MRSRLIFLKLTLWLIPPLITAAIAGCSGSSPETAPGTAYSLCAPNLPWTADSLSASDHNRILWGVWDVTINPTTPGSAYSLSASTDRQGAGHLNITSLVPEPTIVVKTWDPTAKIIGLDITISNPYTISGYDVRLIVYTDSLGHKLTNADDWTSLWDVPGGLPINPFKAYAKTQPNRKFAGQTQYTENCKIYLPNGNLHFRIAIDASYPTNCAEPYELTNFTQGIILDQAGSSTELEVTAHSWGNDVNSVKMYCPSITGMSLVTFHQIDSEKWGYTLVNNTTASSGNYTGYLLATTSKSGTLALYDEVTIKITPLNSGWARTWGGVGEDLGEDIAVDEDGNIYSTGLFNSTVDFNPDPVLEDLRTASGAGDIFLVKYDKYGNFLWVKTWGGPSTENDVGTALDTDSLGNIFVAGAFSLTADFGTDGTPDLHTSNGASDIFLSKYDSNGGYHGTVAFGGTDIDIANRLQVDKDGNVLLTGFYKGTVDFNPGSGTDNHTSKGLEDVFVSKFNSSGAFLWARTWGGNDIWMDNGNGVATDSNANVYVSGIFGGTIDFNPSSGVDNHVSQGKLDAFLSKLDSNGNFQWAKTWGSGEQDWGWECAVDENNDAYVVGNFFYTVDFNPDPTETEERTAVWRSDVFVSKFASDGDFKWVLTWGENDYDEGWVISTNKNGFFCVSSYIKNSGFLLSKFDINGNNIWSQTFLIVIHGGDIGSDGNSYATGAYNGSSYDFDPGPEQWYPNNYSGSTDIFLLKLLPNGYWD